MQRHAVDKPHLFAYSRRQIEIFETLAKLSLLASLHLLPQAKIIPDLNLITSNENFLPVSAKKAVNAKLSPR